VRKKVHRACCGVLTVTTSGVVSVSSVFEVGEENRGPETANSGFRRGGTAAIDPGVAAQDLWQQLSQSDLGFAAFFCSSQYDLPRLGHELHRRFKDCTLVGCTSAGEIGEQGYSHNGMVGFSFSRSDCTTVSACITGISAFDSQRGIETAQGLLEELESSGLEPSPNNTFALLLVDAMSFNEERVIASVSAGLGNIPVFGGSAGDDYEYSATHVYTDGRFIGDSAVLTLIHTQHPFRVISTQHYMGGESDLIVTAADPAQRLVAELNGEPAAREYARCLGMELDYLKTKVDVYPPLMVRIGGTYYARGINQINDDDSLSFACAIDEGVPLSVGRNTGIVENLEKAFNDLQKEIGPPQLVIGFDCLMRKLEAVDAGVDEQVGAIFASNNVVGMSSYGEQVNSMHVNQTFSAVAFGRPGVVPDRHDAPLDINERLLHLERENQRLSKTVNVLRTRVERSFDLQGDNFSLFQNSILLEETVRKRTLELERLNERLAHELTVRREMEEALRRAKQVAEEANLSKTHLLAGVSHDLQQPLNAARLLLGALDESPLEETERELAGQIEMALQTAEDVLVGFLDIAKLDSGAVTPKSHDFPVGPLLAQLAVEFAPQAERRGVAIHMVPSTAVVYTDRSLLHRVLRNLLSNAVRYTHRGKVVFGCRRCADGLRIEVWDTGIGIPKKRQWEVFHPFQRLNERQHEGHRGSGLGLSIVQRICDLLKLRLSVDSEEGRGSGFRVVVPYGQRANVIESPVNQAEEQTTPLQGCNIVVIDDDSQALDSMGVLLRAWGCNPLFATTVDEALAQVAGSGCGVDLAIVDYHLGDGADGIEVAAELRRRCGDELPVVIVSGDRRVEVRKQVSASRCAFLNKPIGPARLRAVLAFELGGAHTTGSDDT